MTTSSLQSPGEDLRLVERRAGQTAEAWLWWRSVPALPGEKLGVIGNFSADGPDATAAILRKAEQELSARGCTMALGPMDGNTWRRYRFVTDAGSEPAFFLEPANPAEWPEWWKAAGYGALASYYSTVTEDLGKRDARLESVTSRLQRAGVSVRPLDLSRFDEDLGQIHDVSIESFQGNFLYTPLPAEAFLNQYRELEARVVPGLVLIAEQAERAVGFVFAIPDFAQAKRGEVITTIIVKTLAVRPGRAYAGLGAWLLGEVHRASQQLGYKRAIHALMHETNQSRNLSAHYSRTLRRYELLSRKISP